MIILCTSYGRNEATLAAQQLRHLLQRRYDVQLCSNLVGTTPTGSGLSPAESLHERYWPRLKTAKRVIWFGAANPKWVDRFFAADIPQTWLPDYASLRSQPYVADRMQEIVCCYQHACRQASQRLRTAKSKIKLLYWAAASESWLWQGGQLAKPVLDLTCGGYRYVSAQLGHSLRDWAYSKQQAATLLYDQLDNGWQQLVRRLPPNSPLQAVKATTSELRRQCYSEHGIWLSLNSRPHLGVLLCEAQSLGLLPLVSPVLTDIVEVVCHWRVLPFLAPRQQHVQATTQLPLYLTKLLQDDNYVTADSQFQLALTTRREVFEDYWLYGICD